MKKRNKVSAEFNMSSLTDIIFLLLIFFMLTSTLVKLDAVELPESDAQTVAPTNITLILPKDGKVKLNNKPIRMSRVQNEVSKLLRDQTNKKDATLTIVAEKTTPWKSVQDAMEIAAKLRMKAILATQPKT